MESTNHNNAILFGANMTQNCFFLKKKDAFFLRVLQDSLSAEKGYPHWHSDVRTDDIPREAGLMFACKIKTDTGEYNNISLKNEVNFFFFFPPDFLGRKAVEEEK